jgi:diguanylate cyclase (GGDEF)-like protein/PAS domain S-box-containing protein
MMGDRAYFLSRWVPVAVVAAMVAVAGDAAAAFTAPKRITVVTDFDYPPYLFRLENGELRGIVRDKWDLWSQKTGIPVVVKGATWIEAQRSVQEGGDDVIETLSYTPDRARLYEYSRPYAPVEAQVFFHHSITGISGVDSLRGFTVGAKEGSACGKWLRERGIALREYPRSESLVEAAGSGEVRLFCMDSMTARYYLYKLRLADDFRASPPLYATQFHWAVKKGRTDLLAFIESGFDKFSKQEMENIDDRWVGNPIEFPLAPRFLYYVAIAAAIALALYVALGVWNRTLRKRVAAQTNELNSALGSLRQAVGAGNVGLFGWDIESNRVHYSPEWKRQIGYDDHEISDTYSEWHDRLHPEDRERVLAVVRACVDQNPHECRVEFRFRHKDGSYRWILAQAGVQFDAHGKASKMLGSHVDITDQKRNEAILAGQARVLELVANGAALEQSLDTLLRVVEAQSSGMLSSILELDVDGSHVRHLAAPSLPAEFRRAVDGAAIGEAAGSCGTALYRRETVIAEDIATDPLWADWRELALSHGLHAAWSTPIFGVEKKVLGSFAMYFNEPRRPSEFDRQLISIVTHTAAIAIAKHREQVALRAGEERLRLAIIGARLGTWHLDMGTRELQCSDACLALCGLLPGSAFSPARFVEMVHPADRDIADAALRRALKAASVYESEFRIIWPDGSVHWLAARGHAYPNRDGRTARMEGIAFDITEQKLAVERIQRLDRVHAMLSSINSVIVRVRDDQELVKEACRLAIVMGRFRCAWIGIVNHSPHAMRIAASHGVDDDFLEELEATLLSAQQASSNALIPTQGDLVVNDVEQGPSQIPTLGALRERGIRAYAILPLVASGHTIGALGLYSEVKESFDTAELELLHEVAGDIAFGLDHIRKEERITFLAYYDPLTGLANRSLFNDRLTAMLHIAERERHTVALCVADLDHFKDVNDAVGRDNGDRLLVEFAKRLLSCADNTEQVARLGSDRFAIALTQTPGMDRLLERIEGYLDRCTLEPFRLADSELHIAARFGVARCPIDGGDADALIRNAEAALKNAKAGGERVLFYVRQMTEGTSERVAMESRLRRALENDEFVLHYQPKVDAAQHKITGVEALVRWRDRLGLALPGTFVPLLEETGLILEVGTWAIRRAIADHALWATQGLAPPRVAVNVSAAQLRQRDFVNMIKDAIGLSSRAVSASPLDLEITESVIMKDVEANVSKLRAIHDLGVKIAIDDFGTGYSSLSYLARLPVQVLKIDVSFVIRMLHDAATMTLVSTMISLAHSLGLSVVAEGVETEEQATALQGMGSDELQGYLVGMPVARDEVAELLRSRTASTTWYRKRSRVQGPSRASARLFRAVGR